MPLAASPRLVRNPTSARKALGRLAALALGATTILVLAFAASAVPSGSRPPPDKDGDGISNGSDNCVKVANPDQADQDADAKGDACDTDIDGDGVSNKQDNCLVVTNPAQADAD